MEMTLADMGSPPAEFAFLLFGSEGRKEQTLKTDQDNAIVFADVAEQDREAVNRYFLELGTRVCDQLHEIGQQHCEFNIMAKNPDWCQPLSVWKKYYRKWVISDDPDRILNAGIFFDFRLGHGSPGLVAQLHSALFAELAEWPGLLRHMARNTLHYRPPLGFFGNFVLQEKGRGKGALDIKSAMRLVVDFGRIYAMQTQMTETNTVKRLRALYDQQRLDKEAFDDLVHAYEFLMHQRLRHQSRVLESGRGEVNNYLRPGDLTTIDQQALKEAFKQIRVAQAKLRVDFFLYLP
jgi:CBS domain-containing protein